MAQQIYAKVKRSSKYAYQNDWAKNDPAYGLPFKVWITGYNDPSGYIVQGGPGGQYRLEDLNLFVIENDREVRIS